ncbi:DeoR family transcriptional regulator [Jatrophihabitans sp. GAS493]|uniref:DeoR/GlpR family DNA-binding transcription regulator n=1 Tax=Jatrophihabitans sp. GAS493 TaxID=1907575 RepID=UPI000BB74A13|nr:DeoR/GlpR family DNA-binding transcription regulator [Jatrophihabitans sp. GAS493]SOD74474.1 DeoR family transcriptional regulator [Jatrophihabitans sp. GAS493]
MLASQRHTTIMDEIRRTGAVRVQDLTAQLGVSDMTIRRDLEQLAERGLVHKVHGGAVLTLNSSVELGFETKAKLQLPSKSAIAQMAATLIRPGSAIALSAGTTTWNLASLVAKIPGLTIVTNSTTVADLIANTPGAGDQTLILTGGVRTPSAALVGPVADLSLRSLHVDQLFLGAHGMHPTAGFTTPNLAEAETNRALIECASQVVVCADSTKWGSVGLASFGALSTAHVLITDDGLSDDAASLLREKVGKLRMAKLSHEDSPTIVG